MVGRLRVGIDVGGTFTDVVGIGEDGDRWAVLKVPSTPSDPSVAVIDGLSRLLADEGDPEVTFLGHGTTAGTNAFLTKSGARTALLATAGFRDVLEFRRMDRSGILDPYELQFDFPAPLVPGRYRIGVAERIGRGGEIIEELDDVEVERVIGLLRDAEIEAVAVCLLWSFENPAHEIRLRDALHEALPDVYVSCSHEIDPSIMEYERSSTTVVNAYLGPLIDRYMRRFEAETQRRELPAPRIMQSNGGLASIHEATRQPVALLESGPAAGVAACSYLAGRMGIEDLLAVDMGGTSFDVALVVGGRPQLNIETEVDGYAVRVPMLDIRSIGAGGGSIAWVDDGGALRVGPQSAGADPGPACYGRGGTLPTVSDANVVLGYLRDLAGGDLSVEAPAAEEALLTHVGKLLDLEVVGAASGVYRLVNAHMADAMRIIASERAMNPGDLALFAYGGAGPMHASALARELEIARTIIPPHPGTLSAMGVGTGDLIHDLRESVLRPLHVLTQEDLAGLFRTLGDRARTILNDEGATEEQISLQPYFAARYIGQMHDLEVPLAGEIADVDLEEMARRFHALHRGVYGFAVEDEPIFVVGARLRAVGAIKKPDFGVESSDLEPEPAFRGEAWFEDGGYVDCPFFQRQPWKVGQRLAGPAVIQEYDSTTLVLPGQHWSVDELGSIVIEEG
ncbi:MAG: hydantoinase/oxoprolinase family protein [Actinobacteria bacterium]|nr:hydantoinase/oxoprolinase family protein [Actinomycetota bacterium]